MKNAEIPLISGSLAFSTIFAMVPFFAVTLAIIKSTAGIDSLTPKVQALLLEIFAETAGIETSQVMQRILTRLGGRSWGPTSAFVLCLTSLRLFHYVELAFNRIWGLHGERPWWKRWPLLMSFFVLLPLAFAVLAGLRSANYLQPFFSAGSGWEGVVVSLVALVAVNKGLPAIKVRWSTALIAAVISTAGLVILTGSLTWLTKKVFNYSKIYGSVAAVPLLCLLALMFWQIVLFGVAIAAALQGKGPRSHTSSVRTRT